MARDWEDVQIGMARLRELIRAAGERPLSKQEAAQLSVAVEAALDIQAEHRKEQPSLERMGKRVAETFARVGRDERNQ